MNAKQTTLDGVRRTLLDCRHDLLLAGPFGSLEEDLDVLLIHASGDIRAFSALCQKLRQAEPAAHYFPTFRLESFVPEPTPSGKVHLLAYPSLELFSRMERPFVRYCISQSFNPWLGSAGLIWNAGESRPAPELDYYKSLLYETLQVFICGPFPYSTRLAEARRKLTYIVKFACLETCYREGEEVDLRRISDTLFATLPAQVRAVAEPLYRKAGEWQTPEAVEVEDAFAQALHLINLLNLTPR